MHAIVPRLRGRWLAATAIAFCAVFVSAAPAADETRALWVLRSSLTSPASITSLVRTAKEQGFNTLLVQVRGRGDAYYTSDLEPRAADLARQPAAFDPLASVLSEAHAVVPSPQISGRRARKVALTTSAIA